MYTSLQCQVISDNIIYKAHLQMQQDELARVQACVDSLPPLSIHDERF
jgi:hypothetical protein